MQQTDTVKAAIQVAKGGLRWCYRDHGIICGSRLVYWSWDSFFASFGALAAGDHLIVRRNLELYLDRQRKDGAVPKRVANPWYFWRFLGFPVREVWEKQRPTFTNTYYTAVSIAQNPTCLIAAHAYYQTTQDREFLEGYYPKLKRIAAYLSTCEGEFGLLKEGIGGGWAESVLKRGAIAFTNICYARSLVVLSELAMVMEDEAAAERYLKRADGVQAAINTVLWSEEDGGYYSDWYSRRRHHHFATDGNLLAIWWGVANADQAAKIEAKIAELDLEDDVPIRLAYDPYDFWRVYLFNRIAGLKDYHVGFCWTWLGCIDVLVKLKLGEREAALNFLERIAQVIARDKTVHEIYDKGKAVHTPFYKSEEPWAWGAGLFLYACAQAGFTVNDTPDANPDPQSAG